ncbi:TfuA domain-containing protein [Streptomyces sp. NBC_00536]|uniref:TfuA-like protein n=1 Tax=Streptomyces sp. NBC_00536 TaxID=2975769 RepID=UPI002E824960|nr:TfuA-like protein [Streptomyces sp. NBC_00536]WUC83458.1 TfuA domain-containing protein [Streptomyces sp. NBC_00536]
MRHKEILALLAEGVTVVGAAGMGALRAAELAPYRMVGVGRIFEDFRSGVLDADDEVAVLHTDDGIALSEAPMNLRAALMRAAADGELSDAEAGRLSDLARSLPYTSQSWTALGRLAAGEGLGPAFGRADAWRCTHAYDVKREDAERALALVAAGLPPGHGPGSWVPASRGRRASSGTGRPHSSRGGEQWKARLLPRPAPSPAVVRPGLRGPLADTSPGRAHSARRFTGAVDCSAPRRLASRRNR